MFVVKRSGKKESVKFDKITSRIEKLCYGLVGGSVDPIEISRKVIDGLYEGVTTTELDNLAAENAASLALTHPDYGILASRIAISNLHKNTSKSFSEAMEALYAGPKNKPKDSQNLISDEFIEVVRKEKEFLDSTIIYNRDFSFDYFGIKTLEKSYLLRINGSIVERPQHMLMRCSLGIHGNDIKSAVKTYDMMSQGFFIHATPTLFNAGTTKPQMSSCFLTTIKDDSIEGIYESLKDCAKISQSAGGIGISIHNIRAKGSPINGTNGKSNGIVPMLKVFNDTARYVDQGGGKRKGAFAIYIEPWHKDILEFMDLKKNHGKEELRARDLFYGLWINDLFMQRVESNQEWSLFCPNDAPELINAYGEEFNAIYTRYEQSNVDRQVIKAQDLWFKIIESQIETGTPYMMYKDACNIKSNQKNIGTILSSNLCTEIVEYTSNDEIAVCNLASVSLPKLLVNKQFDFEQLEKVVSQITTNLNKIIDNNFYPVPEAAYSNKRHRPIGIGVQGLADLFCMLNIPFDSLEAKKLNRDIAETIYYAALKTSNQLAKDQGIYETFKGSPASQGQLQFDLWNVAPSNRHPWDELKEEIKSTGLRNSLLIAPMPTASTSQILGNNECFEPYTSNVYVRRVLSGEYVIINKHLVKRLNELGLWNIELKNKIIKDGGSIQNIPEIPAELKPVYKTVWEIKQKDLIDMAADRGPFVCQSQSLNLFIKNPSPSKITSMHFYAWKKGLKTGMYYLRIMAASKAIQFTVQQKKEPETILDTAGSGVGVNTIASTTPPVTTSSTSAATAELTDNQILTESGMVCELNGDGECEMCSG